MQRKQILLLVSSLILGLAFGYYFAPTKVVTETRIIEVEKKHEDIDQTKHKETRIVKKKNPDGSESEETTVIEDSNKKRETDTTVSRDSESKKEVFRDNGRLTLAALAAVNATDLKSPVKFGGEISTNLIGPIRLGIFGLQDGTAGVSIGLGF